MLRLLGLESKRSPVMRYRFSSGSLLGPLLLSLEESSLAPDSPALFPDRETAVLVRRGRLRSSLPGPRRGEPEDCRQGRILLLSRSRAWSGEGLATGREGASLLSFGFDRDPFPRLSVAFPLDAVDGKIDSSWRGAARTLGLGLGGVESVETLARLIERHPFGAESGTGSAGGEGSSSLERRALDFVTAAALAQLLALLSTAEASGEGEAGSGARAGPWSIEELVDWIDSHYEESFSLDEMTARCALNTSDFSRRFKAATGYPLFEYLNRRRVARAALLLRDGDLPVTEIAFSVGYNNLSFFNRYFLRIMGQNPGEYRRRGR